MDPRFRHFHLDYFSEYPIGQEPSTRRRNVQLKCEFRPNEFIPDVEGSNFAWHCTRKIEDRLGAPLNEGVWPINYWRVLRRIGIPDDRLCGFKDDLASASLEVYDSAHKMRTLCYFRAHNSDEAIEYLGQKPDFRCAIELTNEWYDPPNGVIEVNRPDPEILGLHNAPFNEFDFKHGLFRFRNSWGEVWGKDGHGAVSRETYERFVVEAWLSAGRALLPPITIQKGIVCLEWKWSLSDTIQVHGREIVDAATTDRLGWAFCVRRGDLLDVEEFYVWPEERGKGYGRELAKMVTRLGKQMQLPLRMIVSYADTYEWNLPAVNAAARMLNLELTGSEAKLAHMIGQPGPIPEVALRERPPRPAFMLEWLRPKDETPITSPTDYTVLFGTNRNIVDPTNPSLGFSGDRGTKLHLGSVRVTIPESCRFGSRGRRWQELMNWIWGNRPRTTDTTTFSTSAELGEIANSISEVFGDRAQNILFIHGYRVTFEAAAIQAAQFAVDLKTPGATFLFSWPSKGSLPAYAVDEAAVEASFPYLEDFIKLVLSETGETPLSIIVHSMGNRAMVRFLEHAAMHASGFPVGRLKHVIFAAPDVDFDVFQRAANQFSKVATRPSLYATRADWAVQSSEWLHGYHRAGLCPPVVTANGMDTILVEGFNLLDLGHSYYAAATPVLHDMFNLLHHDAGPERRPRIQPAKTQDGRDYWKLPML
jgi:esterase/lipase superfamily enzyme